MRLALAEKGVNYELVPVDIFAAGGPPASYFDRHPFAKIPAFEHDGFPLFETGAITRYIDETFDGPKLQPINIRERARCNQLLSIAEHYVYPNLAWRIYVERASKPAQEVVTDEAIIAAAIPKAILCLEAISDIMGNAVWLTNETLSLADLYLAPMFDYFHDAGRTRYNTNPPKD